MYRFFLKRMLDFLLALFGIVILFPLILILITTLFYANQGSIFFTQNRPGKDEKIFKLIKFKTMNDKKDTKGVLLTDKERLTPIGRFFRKTSIDELPQLFNVLKGDMSIIGPRPLLPHYLELYDKEQKKRHLIRPGITGLSQVKGRNLMKFSERFKNDTWYVENFTFILDLKIILLTIKKIISYEGVVSGQDVMDVDDLGFNKK